jgi:hypothetical protein
MAVNWGVSLRDHGQWGRLALGAALALALAACARHNPPGSPAPGVSQRPPGSTLAIAGDLFTGEDPAAIRAYLQSVKEVKPTRFDVQWNPATVAVSREEAMRSLRSISLDGSTFRLATSEPVVAKLKPGSILWIWDIAVRKVDRITIEDDVTVVHTQTVSLTEALPRAQIAFDAPVSLSDYYMGYSPSLPVTPTRTARIRRRSGFLPVRLDANEPEGNAPDGNSPDGNGPGGSAPGENTPEGNAPQAGDDTDDTDADADEAFEETTPSHGGYTGKLKGFDYSLAYVTRPDGVTLTLEASNAEEGDETKDTEKEGTKSIAEKFKELSKEQKEAAKEEHQAQKQVDGLQKALKTLDSDYDKNLAQLKTDQADRNDPNYSGPRPPPVPTDSNGFPLSLQGQIDRLTKPYQAQRSVELGKIKEQLKIRAEAQKRKMEAEEARKKLADLGGAAKKLFEIARDNLDVRFRARVDMDNFAVTGLLDIEGGNIENAAAQFKQVNGTVDLAFIGRFGKPGNGAIKVPVMNLPIAFNVPFPIGGLPFVIQLGADFLANVFLAGNHAAMSFNGSFAFNGSGGVRRKGEATNADSTMTGGEPEVKSSQGMSPGVSGLVLGVQVPRLGFGFGAVGMSSVAYLDVVHVLTMTNSAAVAAGMLAPPCRRVSLAATGHVGISTKIVPWPIPYIADKINDALSTKPKEIFKREKVMLDPPIKACEI